MDLLIPDLLQLVLADPKDGDCSTINYPFVKNALQAALALHLERLQSVEVGPEHVTSGPARPCPLGPDFEAMLGRLAKPEPTTHRWFLLSLDPSSGLITDFFSRRLTGAGLMLEETHSHLLVFKKTVHPRSGPGHEKVTQLKPQLERAARALHGTALVVADHPADILMAAWYLDLFRLLKVALGSPWADDRPHTSKESVSALIQTNLIGLNLVRATYQFAHDVQGFASLVSFLDDVTVLLDPSLRPYSNVNRPAEEKHEGPV